MSDDSDPEAAAMAAAMGFSSFGNAAPARKKRKFNSVVDGFVEGEELEKLDRGGRKGKGSGGNQVPLGKVRVFGGGGGGRGQGQRVEKEKEKRNEDEILLDDEDEDDDGNDAGGVRLDGTGHDRRDQDDPNEDEGEDGPRYIDTSLPAPLDATSTETDPDAGPAYMDTSLPPPAASSNAATKEAEAEAAEMQSRIDNILAAIQPPPTDSSSNKPHAQNIVDAPPGTQSYAQTYSGYNLPPPPPPQSGGNNSLPARPISAGFGGGGGMSETASVSSFGGRVRGERNPLWYVGYYDPSFNENPWARLEREKGLVSVGRWVEREG